MGNKVFGLKKGESFTNLYDPPERVGPNPFTRSGTPPPKMVLKGGQDKASHRIHDPMSLELHMADERMRTRGLTDAERQWRHQWLKDQHIHPDEPIHVDAIHRQLNPIRILYRWPLDKLYVHFLRPNFGTMYGSAIRVAIPKALMILFGFEFLYYVWKYEDKSWQKSVGILTHVEPFLVANRKEIEEANPGIMDLGLPDPAKYNYLHPSYDKRVALLDVGETRRPW